MRCFSLRKWIPSMWTVCTRWGSFCVCRRITGMRITWSSVWFTFMRWREDMIWRSLSNSRSLRSILCMTRCRRVSLCRSSSLWIFWGRKDATGLLWSTTSFCWKLTLTIQQPACFAWILTLFPANNTIFCLNSWSTLAHIAVPRTTAFT